MFLPKPDKKILEAVHAMENDGTFRIFLGWIEGAAENSSNILKGSNHDLTIHRAQGALFVLDPLLVVLKESKEMLDTYQQSEIDVDNLI